MCMSADMLTWRGTLDCEFFNQSLMLLNAELKELLSKHQSHGASSITNPASQTPSSQSKCHLIYLNGVPPSFVSNKM